MQRFPKIFSILVLPFVLCSCFPEVNAPELSNMPMDKRTHTPEEVEEHRKSKIEDIDYIQKQKEALLNDN